MKMRLLSAILLIPLLQSALPPGYEDELYCPAEYCMEPKEVNAGFVGPRSMFYQCILEAAKDSFINTHMIDVTPWGFNLGDEVKQNLLGQGYTMNECAGGSTVVPEQPGQDAGQCIGSHNLCSLMTEADCRMASSFNCKWTGGPPEAPPDLCESGQLECGAPCEGVAHNSWSEFPQIGTGVCFPASADSQHRGVDQLPYCNVSGWGSVPNCGPIYVTEKGCGRNLDCKDNKDKNSYWTCKGDGEKTRCVAVCNGKQACVDISFNNKPLWDIECKGGGESTCSNITAATPRDNKLSCSGTKACYNSTFVCPSGETCDLQCSGKEACRDTRFNGTWKVTCGSGQQVCADMYVERRA